jgi:hypothetical protein
LKFLFCRATDTTTGPQTGAHWIVSLRKT